MDTCIVQAHTGVGYAEALAISPDKMYRGMDGGT